MMKKVFKIIAIASLLSCVFVSCEDDDNEAPIANNSNGNNQNDTTINGAFISGDVDGVNYTVPIWTYNEFDGFVQATGIDTSSSLPRILAVAIRKTLVAGTYKMDNGTLNATVLVQLDDTTRNGGQFNSGSCEDFNGQAAYNSIIEFSKLDTVSGEIEGTFNAMAYQGANCIVTDSVLITNGHFRFDFK